MDNAFLHAVLFTCGLLAVGLALRAGVGVLRALFIPAAVVAGAIGFGLVQLGSRVPATSDATLALAAELKSWPGWLIAVVFAGLLLERPPAAGGFRAALRRGAQSGVFAWIIILGQITIGLLVYLAVVRPAHPDVPASFGQLLEVSWAGGHGASAAMGQVYASLGFPEGKDLAFFLATVGLVYGVVSGLVLVNLAVRRGWTAGAVDAPNAGTATVGAATATATAADPETPVAAAGDAGNTSNADVAPIEPVIPNERQRGRDLYVEHAMTPRSLVGKPPRDDTADDDPRNPARTVATTTGIDLGPNPKPIAFARTRGEVLEPLALQVVILAAALGVGYALQRSFALAAGLVLGADDPAIKDEPVDFAQNVPLFLFTLIGGLLVRLAMTTLRLDRLIDGPSIQRLVGVSMEFLIVAAVATMQLSALKSYGLAVALLVMLAGAWSAFCLLYLAPRLLPRAYWFELGLLNYGFSTANTPQGMMLLRIVDPDLRTRAAEDYAVAAPLSAPFVGGGVVTIVALPLLLQSAPAPAVALATAALAAALYAAGRRLKDPPAEAKVG